MKFAHPHADLFIPEGSLWEAAARRTTHLCIAAHQDDIEILAYHGIAECFNTANQGFGGVVVTNGSGSSRRGSYANFTDEQMVQVRREEQRTAAIIGHYTFQAQLAHPSETVKNPSAKEVIADLSVILSAVRPQVLYTHNPADKHDSHIAVLLRTLEAVRSLPVIDRPRKIYGVEVWRNLDWLLDEDKVALAVDRYPNLSAALLGVFDSQISGGKRYDLASRGRQLANATFYNPREGDQADALNWAMDLTPLVLDDTLDLADYTLAYLDRLRQDVAERIQKYR